jgi:hypothetical protein
MLLDETKLVHAISIATAVGFMALAGVAAEFGVVMLIYLTFVGRTPRFRPPFHIRAAR